MIGYKTDEQSKTVDNGEKESTEIIDIRHLIEKYAVHNRRIWWRGLVCSVPIVVILCIMDILDFGIFIIVPYTIYVAVSRAHVDKRTAEIESIEADGKYRITRGKNNRYGICLVSRRKFLVLTCLGYDEISRINECLFICKKDGKFGLYNAEKKWMSDLIYDKIDQNPDGTITATHGNISKKYDAQGYIISY